MGGGRVNTSGGADEETVAATGEPEDDDESDDGPARQGGTAPSSSRVVERTTPTEPPTTEEPAPSAGCQGYTPCLPPGGDVDCTGGSGDGPRWQEGPVTVNQSFGDPYDLDRDGDGVGCESW